MRRSRSKTLAIKNSASNIEMAIFMRVRSSRAWKTDGETTITSQAKNTLDVSSTMKSTGTAGTISFLGHSTREIGAAAWSTASVSLNSQIKMYTREVLVMTIFTVREFTGITIEIFSTVISERVSVTEWECFLVLTEGTRKESGWMINFRFDLSIYGEIIIKCLLLI